MKGKLIFKKRAHNDYISDISVSKSGNFIVTTSYQPGDNLKFWNRNGKLLANLKGQRGPVFNPEISPDENELLSTDGDDNAFLWDLKKKEGKILIKNIENHNIESSISVHFTADGKNVYSEYTGNKVFFWDLEGNLNQVLNEHGTFITNSMFNHKGNNFLTTGLFENSLLLWNMKNCKIQDTFSSKGNLDSTEKAKYSVNYINDSTAEIRNNSNKILGTFYGLNSHFCDFYFSPTGKGLIYTNFQVSDYWSINKDTLIKIKRYPFTGWNIRYSMSDTMFIVYDNSDSVSIYKNDGSLINTLRGTGESNVFAFSPDNKLLLTGSDCFDILVRNLNGKIVTTLKGLTSDLCDAAFSPDGKYILTVSRTVSGNKICNIWDFGGHLLGSYDIFPMSTQKLTWDKNSEFIQVYYDDETIEVLPAPWKLAQFVKNFII
jgi:WD40 repeat protein